MFLYKNMPLDHQGAFASFILGTVGSRSWHDLSAFLEVYDDVLILSEQERFLIGNKAK
jgi:hypothetical protein